MTRPSMRYSLPAGAALILTLPAWLPPGTADPMTLRSGVLVGVACLWMALLAGVTRENWPRRAGALVALPVWLWIRPRFAGHATPEPEDLLVALGLLLGASAGGWKGGSIGAVLTLLFPWGWFHLVGGLPTRWETAYLLLVGAGLVICAQAVRPRPRMAAGLFLAAVLLSILSRGGLDGKPKPGRVVFDESHQSWGSSLRLSLGAASPDRMTGVGHGDLAWLLDRWGYRVSTVKSWSAESLGTADILVLPFSTQRYGPDERQRILKFVHSGGGLLAIGEHTNMQGVMESLNPLLEPLGLALNFDTVWTRSAHRERLFHAAHPLTLMDRHLGVANGGSVAILGQAGFPLLMAKWGLYSDRGDPQGAARSWLGDSRFQERQEDSADLILAAAAAHGQGRVILLGDSTYFQNGGLADSLQTAWATFHWLNHREGLPVPLGAVRWLALVLAVAGFGLLGSSAPRILGGAAALSILAVQLITAWAIGPTYGRQVPVPGGSILVDQSHAESLALYHRRRTRSSTALDAFLGVLRSAGRFPVVHFEGPLDEVDADPFAGIVLPAPRTPLSQAELDWLDQMVGRGAVCLLVPDPAFPEASRQLMADLGVALGPLPAAARAPLRSEAVVYQLPGGPLLLEGTKDALFDGVRHLRFMRPWELTFPSKSPAGSPAPPVRSGGARAALSSPVPLAMFRGAPVVTLVERGRGRYVVLADPALLHGSALEGKNGPLDRERWRFLANLFRSPKPDTGQGKSR